MNEQDLADQFSRDVDEMLKTGSLPPVEAAPADYRQALALARKLSTADLSSESRQRLALRRHWLSGLEMPAHASAARPGIGAAFSRGWVRRLAPVGGIGAALLVIHLAWSGALQAGVAQLNDTVRQTNIASSFNQFLAPLGHMSPVTTTLGIVVDPWAASAPPTRAPTFGIPAGSTTVPFEGVVGWSGPPK